MNVDLPLWVYQWLQYANDEFGIIEAISICLACDFAFWLLRSNERKQLKQLQCHMLPLMVKSWEYALVLNYKRYSGPGWFVHVKNHIAMLHKQTESPS